MDEALQALEEALVARPDFAEAHNNKGLTLLLADRKEDALASFMAAVDSNPQFMQGYFGATQVLNQLGRHDEAASLLQRAIDVRASEQCGTFADRVARHVPVCLRWRALRVSHCHTFDLVRQSGLWRCCPAEFPHAASLCVYLSLREQCSVFCVSRERFR